MFAKLKSMFAWLFASLKGKDTPTRDHYDYVVFWCESLEDGFARKKEKYPRHEFVQYLECPGGARLSKMVLRKLNVPVYPK